MKTTVRFLSTLASAGFLLATAGLAATEPSLPPGAALVMHIAWKSEKLPTPITLEHDQSGDFISIVQKESQPVNIQLWSKSDPGIHTRCYALRGRIRYRDVAGISYLNLWNEFAGPEVTSPKQSYFTRTLAEEGPLKKLTGTSDWRQVVIPFDASQSKTLPTRLELDLALAGAGTVELSDLDLLEFADPGAMWASLGLSQGTAMHPSLPWRIFIKGGTFGLLLLSLLLIPPFLWWRRRQAELRRMRAMDAG